MEHVSIVMAYYENGGMLDRHFEEWAKYGSEITKYFKAVIVDDGSKKNPAEKHIPKNAPFPVALFRIKEDIPWNQNGARNLAMSHAKGWCLLTDMDHLLSLDQARVLLNLKKKKEKYYVPMRKRASTNDFYKRHPNSYVLHSDLYWEAGGFDEAYAGYYGTDSTFRRRLSMVGKRVELNDLYLTLFGREVIPDASTTNYGRKGSKYHVSKNPELSLRKKNSPLPESYFNFKWERVNL